MASLPGGEVTSYRFIQEEVRTRKETRKEIKTKMITKHFYSGENEARNCKAF